MLSYLLSAIISTCYNFSFCFSNSQALAILRELGTQTKLGLVFFFFILCYVSSSFIYPKSCHFSENAGGRICGSYLFLVTSYLPLFHMDSLKQNKAISVFRKCHWTFALEPQKSSLHIPSVPIFRKPSGTDLSFAVPNLHHAPPLYPFSFLRSKRIPPVSYTVLSICCFGCLCPL